MHPDAHATTQSVHGVCAHSSLVRTSSWRAYHCPRAYARHVHPLTRAPLALAPFCTRVTPLHVHTRRACLLLHTSTTIRASVFFRCACTYHFLPDRLHLQ